MGRWSYSNRRTVEESKAITTKWLNKNDFITGGVERGGVAWSFNGEKTGSIGFIVSTVKGNEYIRFQYVQIDQETKEATRVDYKVQLTSTPTSSTTQHPKVVYLPTGSQWACMWEKGWLTVFRRKTLWVSALL